MGRFYNAETKEPINVLYISSSGKANIMYSSGFGFNMRRTEVLVANGPGTVESDSLEGAPPGDYRYSIKGLKPGSSLVALDSSGNPAKQIPVKAINEVKSFAPISERFQARGMKIDLDSHIDYVCYASDILGEGISFRPKSAAELTTAITDSQVFHHDDRSDFLAVRRHHRRLEKAIAK